MVSSTHSRVPSAPRARRCVSARDRSRFERHLRKCNKRYSIADDKVRGKSVKIRCKKCQALISSAGSTKRGSPRLPAARPAGPPLGQRGARASAEQRLGRWFAMVKGKQVGPFDHLGLGQKVKGGEICPKTFVWRQGMGDWKRAGELPEMSRLFSARRRAACAGPRGAAADPGRAARGAPPGPRRAGPRVNWALPGLRRAVLGPRAAHLAPARGGQALPRAEEEEERKKEEQAVHDPFAALGEMDPDGCPPPGEATQFFIAQAGVNKRNPPWKSRCSWGR